MDVFVAVQVLQYDIWFYDYWFGGFCSKKQLIVQAWSQSPGLRWKNPFDVCWSNHVFYSRKKHPKLFLLNGIAWQPLVPQAYPLFFSILISFYIHAAVFTHQKLFELTKNKPKPSQLCWNQSFTAQTNKQPGNTGYTQTHWFKMIKVYSWPLSLYETKRCRRLTTYIK